MSREAKDIIDRWRASLKDSMGDFHYSYERDALGRLIDEALAGVVDRATALANALRQLCEAGPRGPSGHDWMRAHRALENWTAKAAQS